MSTDSDGGGELIEGAIRAVTTGSLQGAQMIAQRRQWAAQGHLHERQQTARNDQRHHHVRQNLAGPANPGEQISQINQPAGLIEAEKVWLHDARDKALGRTNNEVSPAQLLPTLDNAQAAATYEELVANGHHVGYQQPSVQVLSNYADARESGQTPHRVADLQAEVRSRLTHIDDLRTFREVERSAYAQAIRVATIQRYLAQLEGAEELRTNLQNVSAAIIRISDTATSLDPEFVDRAVQNCEAQAISDYGYQPADCQSSISEITAAESQVDPHNSHAVQSEEVANSHAHDSWQARAQGAAAIDQNGFSQATTAAALIHDMTFGAEASASVTGGTSWPTKAKGRSHITAARGNHNRRTIAR